MFYKKNTTLTPYSDICMSIPLTHEIHYVDSWPLTEKGTIKTCCVYICNIIFISFKYFSYQRFFFIILSEVALGFLSFLFQTKTKPFSILWPHFLHVVGAFLFHNRNVAIRFNLSYAFVKFSISINYIPSVT